MQINDTLDGRQARYKGEISPALWYWTLKRGDKSSLRGVLSHVDLRRLVGIARRGNNLTGRDEYIAICNAANGYYYEIWICLA
jgi:hypothetical protein